jgi:hypothetical protein
MPSRMAGRLIGAVAALALLPATAWAGTSSLPRVSSGARPGPDILYAAAPRAPQLENTGVWNAPPILVSGATAYRDREFLYQDFLFDDAGAKEANDPSDPRTAGNSFSKPNGTYTYPTAAGYANNAADLVELRVKPVPGATAFRVTLNTLKDPSLTAFSIAIGGTVGAPMPFPAGANVRAPADLFLTVHPSGGGMAADLVHAGTNAPVSGGAPIVTVDKVRRQVEVRVPTSAWDPGTSVVRLAAGVGLWDNAAGRYLTPQLAADAGHPGGSGGAPAPPAFFNVAFRTTEPFPKPSDVVNTSQNPAWRRDRDQAVALATGDISQFHADVDFAKLRGGVDDDSGVPSAGPMDRIFASHFETAQGADFSQPCITAQNTCKGEYQSQLQPYAIYVPRKAPAPRGYGMTLLLHSLGAGYNQYSASNNQSQFGERGPGSIVITPEGRGPDGFYANYAGADTFEVWADVARHFRLDPAWTVITGYSMGGFGTFKLGAEFPDLFAKAQPTVGESQDTNVLPSFRNLPVLMWNASTDELVPETSYGPTALKLDQLGYRYELDIFTAEHLTLAINDEYAPAADFLGTDTVNRNPPHVTFVADPPNDHAGLGFVADHAYWLSNVKPRSAADAQGTIDVLSHGFGAADAPPSATGAGAGTLTGGTFPALAFTRTFKTWGAPPPAPKADALDITATNIRTVTVDTRRARVSCAPKLNVKSDGPIAVVLGSCGKRLLPAKRCVDRRKFTFRLHHAKGARVVSVAVYVNGKRKVSRRGRDIRRVTLRRLPRKRFKVRIVATQSSGGQLVSTRTYRGCAKSRPHTRRGGRR